MMIADIREIIWGLYTPLSTVKLAAERARDSLTPFS